LTNQAAGYLNVTVNHGHAQAKFNIKEQPLCMINCFCFHVTGSQGSTGSESDCQSLHGGVCAKQNYISTKDCNIAKEALEILVTCLKLRSELIGKFPIEHSLPAFAGYMQQFCKINITCLILNIFYLLELTCV